MKEIKDELLVSHKKSGLTLEMTQVHCFLYTSIFINFHRHMSRETQVNMELLHGCLSHYSKYL